jgi:hypothetical protein
VTTTIQKPTPVTDDDLRHTAETLAEVEDFWSKLASLSDPTIPCDECGGAGTLPGGGIFGEIECPTCHGKRVVAHPAAHHLKQLAVPDFESLRRRLHRLSAAHDEAQRKAYLGQGEGISPVTHEQLAELDAEVATVREQGRDLAVKQVTERRALPSRRPTKALDNSDIGDRAEWREEGDD